MQSIDVHGIVEGSRFNRFHALILSWSMLILILDGYDLAIVGAALPSIMEGMGVDATQAGVMASSALFGMTLGAIFLGTLADKIGRRLMLSICIALFSIFTAAAGLTTGPVSFSVVRFLAGLGIGGVLPIVTAQMAEFSPYGVRARLVTLVFAGYSIGGILVAAVGKQLIETWGWQSVFFTAVAPVLLIPFIMTTMPESMPFLIRNGRDADLRRTIPRLSPTTTIPDNARFEISKGGGKAPVSGLFREGRGLSTAMIWIAFFMGLFMVYALSSWLTKLMALAGYSLGSALTFVIVFNFGAMVGAVLGGWLGDRYNIKYVLVAYYLTGALSLVLMGYTRSTELLFVVVFVVVASALGAQLLAYAYAGAYYPTAMRSTGVGFASGIGRAGAILAPIVIGIIVELNLPIAQNFMAIAAAGVLGTVAVMLIDHKRSAAARRAVNRETMLESGRVVVDGAA
ncbi:MFS transporter [Agrobacterium deltaense]